MNKITMVDMDFSDIEKRIIANINNNTSLSPCGSRAALHFNIPIEEVTILQRRVGKKLNFIDMYGFNNAGTITGRFKTSSPEFQEIDRSSKKDES